MVLVVVTVQRWRRQRQRGGGSTAAAAASLVALAAWWKHLWRQQQRVEKAKKLFFNSDVHLVCVAEVQSFRWDIYFFGVHFELFLDAHGQRQDAILEFWTKIENRVQKLQTLKFFFCV